MYSSLSTIRILFFIGKVSHTGMTRNVPVNENFMGSYCGWSISTFRNNLQHKMHLMKASYFVESIDVWQYFDGP